MYVSNVCLPLNLDSRDLFIRFSKNKGIVIAFQSLSIQTGCKAFLNVLTFYRRVYRLHAVCANPVECKRMHRITKEEV